MTAVEQDNEKVMGLSVARRSGRAHGYCAKSHESDAQTLPVRLTFTGPF